MARVAFAAALTVFLYSSFYTDSKTILIKVGGSSVTDKSTRETLNFEAIRWFADAMHDAIAAGNASYILVHGAGSFGHHSAKEYGLQGQTKAPPLLSSSRNDCLDHRNLMEGVAKTRFSVQKLNQAIISAFLEHGVPAVGISPCFSVPGMQAHGGDNTAKNSLVEVVRKTVQAGLIPILHGDACLYGENGAGILSGDTVMEILGSEADYVSSAVFLTDVDGVYTADPKIDPTARQIPLLQVNAAGELPTSSQIAFDATASVHECDVTGGLKASLNGIFYFLSFCTLTLKL
jgi:isopentenyl phosphate kinase